jgi:hypothetical protein
MLNVQHSQVINHTIKTRGQREHNSLMQEMLNAASLGAAEKVRLQGQKLVGAIE